MTKTLKTLNLPESSMSAAWVVIITTTLGVLFRGPYTDLFPVGQVHLLNVL